MAISASSAAISSLTSNQSLVCTARAAASSLSQCSLSSLHVQFPLHLRRQLRISDGRSLSRTRAGVVPLVQAKHQTFSSFDELIKSAEKPVLVDFYATWCGPCQLMVPILDKASAALKDKVQIVKIDTEKYPTLADKYRIEALPTFILFKDGEPCDRFEGALPVEKLIQRIESSLAVKQ
ncbi:hypothetical protein Cgig2_011803 [Carnegiea gigantea]|uniref:Thioredoxin domain-containing protein n=1 Tax=Carnegiea gigantea TaxID=171969 RepID=A0A9Q1GTY7_9CARY|nr:hypothetical protein Cgig2_011803 [Carnegiea gigantea]